MAVGVATAGSAFSPLLSDYCLVQGLTARELRIPCELRSPESDGLPPRLQPLESASGTADRSSRHFYFLLACNGISTDAGQVGNAEAWSGIVQLAFSSGSAILVKQRACQPVERSASTQSQYFGALCVRKAIRTRVSKPIRKIRLNQRCTHRHSYRQQPIGWGVESVSLSTRRERSDHGDGWR